MNVKVSYVELGMYDADDYRSGAFDMDLVPLSEPMRVDDMTDDEIIESNYRALKKRGY